MHSIKWGDLVETLESFMHCSFSSLSACLPSSLPPHLFLRTFELDCFYSSHHNLLFWFGSVIISFSQKICIIQGRRTTVGFPFPPLSCMIFLKKFLLCWLGVLGPRRSRPLKQQELCAFHIAVQFKENPVGSVIGGYLWNIRRIFAFWWLHWWLWNFYMCTERFWAGSMLLIQDSFSHSRAHGLLGLLSSFSSGFPPF